MTGQSWQRSYWDEVRAIDAALTQEERDLIVERFTAVNAHWKGAQFDDILEAMIDGDYYVAQTDPFLGEWHFAARVVTGTRLYACYAVLAAGRELTVENVTGLLERARLLG